MDKTKIRMKAKSIKGKTPTEIQSELMESVDDGFQPTLAIVFTSIKQDIQSICDILDKKDISIFGATSSGEFERATHGKHEFHNNTCCVVTLKEK